jgi:3-phosphoglycerate kinase
MDEVEETVLAAAGPGAVASRLDRAQPGTKVLREEHAGVVLPAHRGRPAKERAAAAVDLAATAAAGTTVTERGELTTSSLGRKMVGIRRREAMAAKAGS